MRLFEDMGPALVFPNTLWLPRFLRPKPCMFNTIQAPTNLPLLRAAEGHLSLPLPLPQAPESGKFLMGLPVVDGVVYFGFSAFSPRSAG